MFTQFKLVHVLNSDGIGGAESLVRTLCNRNSNIQTYISHEKIFIAKSRLSKMLFRKRIFWIIPVISLAITILFRLLIHKYLGKKIFLIYVFHLAETHVVLKLLSMFQVQFNNSSLFIYLHQSRYLYPKKLTSTADNLLAKYPVICYSKSATQSWFSNLNFSPPKRFVIHNIVDNSFLTSTLNNDKSKKEIITLLFIGRFVEWKRPEVAVQFAIKLSRHYKVKLVMVGINEDEFFKKYDDQISTPKNLSIIFEGPQSDVFRYFKNADLLVNLFDTKQSGECIGITAQESLCMGVPVVIPSEGLSDFKLEPGIYHDKDFLDSNLNTSSIYPSYILNKLFKGDLHLNNQEIGYWREKTSRKRYNRDLLNFIKTIENL